MGSSLRDDYILRQIRDAVDAVARLMGLRTSGRFETARLVLEAAFRSLIGPEAGLVSRMDAATGARLLGDASRMAVMADLLHEEAELDRACGRPDFGDAARRAVGYAREACAADPMNAEYRALADRLAAAAGAGQSETFPNSA